MDIIGVPHRLEYKSFDTILPKTSSSSCTLNGMPTWARMSAVSPFPTKWVPTSNYKPKTFHDLRGLVILRLENLKLNSNVTNRTNDSLHVVMRERVLHRPEVKIGIQLHKPNLNACARSGPPQV
jgi:hypothetical protein